MTNPIKPQIAFLGAGLMGEPMIRRLVGAGYLVHVWNRTRAKAEAIEHVLVADTPAAAAADAAIVITMLLDADAVDDAMGGDAGALSVMADDDIWIQMSTVGLDGAYRLGQLAAVAGVTFVDAPVLGTRKPAEDGALKVLASGPDEAIERCRPVFEVFGSLVEGLGEAGRGSRLKLVVNEWVFALTDATAAALALARNLELDPTLFLSVIEGTATDSPYAHAKGGQMLAASYPASFALSGAAKDAKLIQDACRSSNTDDALISAIREHFDTAVEHGHGDEDMAAVFVVH